jgi:hypothetical protein
METLASTIAMPTDDLRSKILDQQLICYASVLLLAIRKTANESPLEQFGGRRRELL